MGGGGPAAPAEEKTEFTVSLTEVGADKIAHGIAILLTIQSAHRDAAGIRLGGIECENVALDPVDDFGDFGVGGLVLVGRRHDV